MGRKVWILLFVFGIGISVFGDEAVLRPLTPVDVEEPRCAERWWPVSCRGCSSLVPISLFAVVLWIFAMGRRRWKVDGGNGDRLRILETRPLGHRQYLVVAVYGEQKMLLGLGPSGVTYLCGWRVSPKRGNRRISAPGDLP
ncbi:MAG: flagellar biosynthetic protein FliO [Puniceicoccales bacterium]|nr:flagellar biosynthetic protein FliO [Puniceicoccales bacterium]